MTIGTSDFPTVLDTASDLVEGANKASSTLTSTINSSVTTIPVASIASFSTTGIVVIDNEIISYSGKSGTDLTGCVRGIEGTTAASHTNGSTVEQQITAASNNAKGAAIAALEAKIGIGASTPVAGTSLRSSTTGTSTWQTSREVLTADRTYYVGFNLGDAVITNASPATAAVGKCATVTIASPAVVTATAHGLTAGSTIVFQTSGTLPTGITAGTTYFVISTGLTADSFQFSTSSGGVAVNTSGTQSGYHVLSSAHGLANGSPITLGSPPTRRQVTMTIASPAVVTLNSHGYLDNQPVEFKTTGALPTGVSGFSATFTVTTSTFNVTCANHGLVSGDRVQFSTTGTLPTVAATGLPLATGTNYYVRVADKDTFYIALSRAYRQVNSTFLHSFTTTGSGTHTVTVMNKSKTYFVRATNKTANTFEFSETIGGAAVNTSGTQSGVHFSDSYSREPFGLRPGITYYVVNSTTRTFQLASTAGGAAINTTSAQIGYLTACTGNDSGTGLTYSAQDAFFTPQKAVDVAASIDTSAYNVTIQFADGEYNVGAAGLLGKTLVGSGQCRLIGNQTYIGNVRLRLTGIVTFNSCLWLDGVNTYYKLWGFGLVSDSIGRSWGIMLQNGSKCSAKDLELGLNGTSGFDALVRSSSLSVLTYELPTGTLHLLSPTAYVYEGVSNGVFFTTQIATYFIGSPGTTTMLFLTGVSSWASNGTGSNPFYGTIETGSQFSVSLNSVANSNGAFVAGTFFPGTTGTTATGGQVN